MVARQLGIPHGTARSRLHYALDALREQLQNNALREQRQDPARPQPHPVRPQPHPARPQSRAAA